VTVKELHTFTDEEIETIADALKIANAHYHMMAETHGDLSLPLGKSFHDTFLRQAHDAGTLQLKIEAAK
jgi:hypothetical protein